MIRKIKCLAGVSLLALITASCSGGSGGGGGQTVNASFWACQIQLKVDDSTYILPQNCFGAHDPSHIEFVSPTTGMGPNLQLRGVCTCQQNEAAAETVCNSGSCSETLQQFFDDKGRELNSNVVFPTIACEAVSVISNAPIQAVQTPEECVFSGPENVDTITSGLTTQNGDWEAPLEAVNIAINVRKVVSIPLAPDIVFDQTRNFSASGGLRYSVFEDGLGGCRAGGCPMQVDSLVLETLGQSQTFDPPDVVADDVSISEPEIRAIGTLSGTVQADGTVALSGEAVVRFRVDGAPNALTTVINLGGMLDRATGNLVLGSITLTSGDTGDSSGRKRVTVEQLDAVPVAHPPSAVLSAPASVECVKAADTAVALSAAQSADLENDIRRVQWVMPDGSTVLGAQATAHLALGPNLLGVLVSDSRLGTGTRRQNIQVVDTTKPTLTAPATNSYILCDSGNEPIVLAPPSATDSCQGISRVFGTVGGTTFEAGEPVVLPAGNQVVTWSAVDGSGNVGTLTQNISVAPALLAFNRFDVRDRGKVTVSGSARFAALGNSGPNGTEIGANAHVGEVRSSSRVFLRSASTVHGNVVTSLPSIDRQAGSTVNGLVLTNTNPQLPSSIATFAPSPPPRGDHLVLEAGPVRTLSPGAYGNVIVHPNAVVTLSSGRYTFESLIFDSGATWRVPAGANVEVVIRQNLTHRGNFVIQGGTTANVAVLLYGSTAFIGPNVNPNAFYGWRLLAPNAAVTISDNLTVSELMARGIEVAADRTLACIPRL
jgi:hypothetical protein